MNCPFDKKFPSCLMKDDIYFMQLAYNQAIEAWKKEEVPIGALIVHDQKVIALAHNAVEKMKDPTAHAEILAISQASKVLDDWRLNEAILYVTKEPCIMCAGASVLARFKRVVYAVGDPKIGALGGALSVHQLPRVNHHLEVAGGILEEDCKVLLQSFFALRRKP